MKPIYIIVALIFIVITGVFLITGDFFQAPQQICYLSPLEKTSIDLYYDCEDFPKDTELELAKINHDELVTYSLNLINEDRVNFNTLPVELGESSTAQEHAEELLNLCRTSYWSSNGMKPYMRYSIAGGEGAINENVRVIGTPELQKYWTQESIEQVIAWNQYSMVERDELNSFKHAMNILHPDHNYINVGIAWNDFCVAIVQQFENKYVEWSQKPVITLNKKFMLTGTINFNATIEQIDIFYDTPPLPLSDQDLMLSPANYGFGHVCTHIACSENSLPVGIVLPKSEASELEPDVLEDVLNEGSNIPLFLAQKWEVTRTEDSTTFSVEEDLTELIDFVAEASNTDGKGIYTVLVWALPEGSTTGIELTTISIFFL